MVEPGDGSSHGMREPHVYYSAQIYNTRDGWREFEVSPSPSRCGLYDWNWGEDVVELSPGESLAFESWVLWDMFSFPHSGPVRLYVHYAYGGWDKRQAGKMDVCDELKSMPAFEVVSDAVEFHVLALLSLEVKVKGEFQLNVPRKVSSILDVSLHNLTDRQIDITPPGYGWFIVISDGKVSAEPVRVGKRTETITYELDSGNELLVLGDGQSSDFPDWVWTCHQEGTVRAQVIYHSPYKGRSFVLKSEWVELAVVK